MTNNEYKPYTSKWWQARAEEVRSHLDKLTDPLSVDVMRTIMKSYEQMAMLSEAREAAGIAPHPL